MKRSSIIYAGAAILLVLTLAACGTYEQSKEKRAQQAAQARGPIEIAIVWPVTGRQYPMVNGVTLAVDEINRAGGVLGRELKTRVYDESADNGHAIARRIAKDENIVAVIGHITSSSAIQASVTYEENGVIFLAPASTNPMLTAHSFNYVFRTTPSDTLIGQQLARFTRLRGYRQVIILDDNTIFGAGLAATYHAAVVDLGIDVLSHKAYFAWQADYKSLANEYTKQDFDAIFLAGEMPTAAILIKQFRAMGIEAPFISGDSLDTVALPRIAGAAADGTIVPSVFDPDARDPEVRQFSDAFEQRFHAKPENWEALGYDTVRLLAFAFEKSGSTVPIIAASTLRVTKHWQGVTGDFTYDAEGDLMEKDLYFKQMKDGQFQYLVPSRNQIESILKKE